MAYNLHAIEQMQLRRQPRDDGVGRLKFDFHTGRPRPGRGRGRVRSYRRGRRAPRGLPADPRGRPRGGPEAAAALDRPGDLGIVAASRSGEDAPKVTLVGKGVCFDTGGLDIKPAAAMLTMKKDMGGAAHVLGLAAMVMDAQLPVRLRVLVPAVENAISGDAFRPGDVLVARNGKTTEIGNTDAEGRLVLADALVEACREAPDLLVDCATLTGAGRVALGTDVPCLFANDEGVAVADVLVAESAKEQDQVWRLPLWQGYREEINGKVADLKNIGNGPYGGAITAALYLAEFVEPAAEGGAAPPWLHLDMTGIATPSSRRRVDGVEDDAMRARTRC